MNNIHYSSFNIFLMTEKVFLSLKYIPFISSLVPLKSIEQSRVREGRPATTISSPSHNFFIFSSEPPRNPRSSNIIFLTCLILQDKSIFQESGVNEILNCCKSKKIVFIEFKFTSSISLKMFIFLTRIFIYSRCKMLQIIPSLQNFTLFCLLQ